MVVIAASICTRGGKAVLSRQFREVARSRIEALLASFPNLVQSRIGSQHTVVEQDSVRFVYQPLDELYIVLITNKASNILQDINSLHLFSQVVTSICEVLDEREILDNAFELISAFDEVVALGHRENLSLPQIKSFLEMESHEEALQEIIQKNKEFEAAEERKRKAKQLELQRKESRLARANMGAPLTSYPTYTPPPVKGPAPVTIDAYEAEKKKPKSVPLRTKGMQLGKKSKASDIFEKVRGDLPDAEDAPLVSHTPSPALTTSRPSQPAVKPEAFLDHESVHVSVSETVTARLSRDGALKSYEINGGLRLQIHDQAANKVKLRLSEGARGSQFRTHPKIDKAKFVDEQTIQPKEPAKGFLVDNSPHGVLRWDVTGRNGPENAIPIAFTVWINRGDATNITLEYESKSQEPLNDVVIAIPFSSSEPNVLSDEDTAYEFNDNALEWHIGTVDENNSSGNLEFESASVEDENEFFPMSVRFSKPTPFADVDVSSVEQLESGEPVKFSKEHRTVAKDFLIE